MGSNSVKFQRGIKFTAEETKEKTGDLQKDIKLKISKRSKRRINKLVYILTGHLREKKNYCVVGSSSSSGMWLSSNTTFFLTQDDVFIKITNLNSSDSSIKIEILSNKTHVDSIASELEKFLYTENEKYNKTLK